MLGAASHPPVLSTLLQPQDVGISEIGWIGDRALQLKVRGYADTSITQRNMRKLEALIEDHPADYLIIDLSEMTGFDVHGRFPTTRTFQMFRERGGREIRLVCPSFAVRMLASAISVTASVRIRMFASNMEATKDL